MLYAIIAVIVLIADQWVKYWTTINIVLDTGEAALFPGFVKLVNVHNSGAAFGILSSAGSARWIFVIIAIVFVLALFFVMARRMFPSKFASLCCTLAIAGAIGNCIDRFIYGYVVDMFKLEFINFAVFNVADIVLVLACLLFILYLLFGYKEPEEAEEEEAAEDEEEADEVAVSAIESAELPEDEAAPISVKAEPKKEMSAAAKQASPKAEPESASKPDIDEIETESASFDPSEFSLDSILEEFK